MLEPAYQADVVVVGAGVAGLAAAHRLISAGVTTAVLEAAPYVGGRMSTEKVDGFRLDRIGQFLSTSYPELRLTPGLDALYERVRAQRGIGAGLLRGRRCGACRIEIDRTTMSKIQSSAADDVVTCDECGAILVRTGESGL